MLTNGLPAAELRRRVSRLIIAFATLGAGVALTVRADLGLSPWDVLHQGVSERVGLPIGFAGILVGGAVLLLWIPLGTRPGLATILNFILIGTFVDLTLLVLPEDPSTALRWVELAVGVFLFGPGVAAYLACGLGAGPRDGVMTAIVDRGLSLRVVRTLMEVSVLIAGYLLGGTVGIGTLAFAFGIGPAVELGFGLLVLLGLARQSQPPVRSPAS